jgi:tRNA-specific adenosine deaminase 3
MATNATPEPDNKFSFVEILPEQQEQRPRTVQAYAIQVEPQQCSKVVKQLSRNFPLSDDLSHLKRVRKPKEMRGDNNDEESAKKKPKLSLQVLVGAEQCEKIQALYGPLYPVTVPGRPPQSNAEWKEFNNELWSTNFVTLKSKEQKEEELALESKELVFMKQLMDEVVVRNSVVIVVDPSNQNVVARSEKEEIEQKQVSTINPLATPILLALQGVSRLERKAATNLTTDEFSRGQYLCTGYDLYTYYEPTVFEAMACVHSRLRRLIFLGENNGSGVWSQAFSKHRIHCLPGTNHKYRAFEYKEVEVDGVVKKSCEKCSM